MFLAFMLGILVYSVDSDIHSLNNWSQADFSVLFCSSRDNQSLFQELSNIFSEDSNQQSSRELLMKVLHQYLFNFYSNWQISCVLVCFLSSTRVQAHIKNFNFCKLVAWIVTWPQVSNFQPMKFWYVLWEASEHAGIFIDNRFCQLE